MGGARAAADGGQATAPLDVAVVGGGLAGLSVAEALLRARPGLRLRVFEAAPAAGGKVRSSRQEGFTLDWGPNGFLRQEPAMVALVEALGLQDSLRSAQPSSRRRYVYVRGALHPFPSGPRDLIGSRLLPPLAKLRALVGAARAVAPAAGEESVHAFLARRLGQRVASGMGELLVGGLCAGDPAELSMDALFPRLKALEAEQGSLLRGLRAAAAAARSRPPGLDGRLTSFAGGMQTLVDALAARLGERLQTGRAVTWLRRRAAEEGGGYRLQLAGHPAAAPEVQLDAAAVVLATPAFAAAELLADLAPAAARPLAQVPYADVSVVALGYDVGAVPRALDGFGFLVPRGQAVRSLGVLWSSAVLPDQAPPGSLTLRAIAGGRLDPGFADLDDEQAVQAVRQDLRLAMGVQAAPRTVMVRRWRRGIPQLSLGHAARVHEARVRLAEAAPGVVLAGNYLSGVAMNDVVREAAALAKEPGWLDGAGPS